MNPNPAQSPHVPQSSEDLVRQVAYFHWIDSGCPTGNDWAHWFAAEQRLLVAEASLLDAPRRKPAPSPHLTIRSTLAAHASDPTHRFHEPAAAHDARLNVVAGEARQRVRGRHLGGSLRSPAKQAR